MLFEHRESSMFNVNNEALFSSLDLIIPIIRT